MSVLVNALLDSLGFEATPSQERVVISLAGFLTDQQSRVFVLNGYAGTGKTTLIASLLRVMQKAGRKVVLMAPTGRAAKVMSGYSGGDAATIHKRIYKVDEESGRFLLREASHSDTIFIVDEASMVSYSDGSGQNLLDDLFEFVFSGNNARLILSGDLAQLPPIGMTVSPALNPGFLRRTYGVEVTTGVLDDVVRQQQGGGILHNATILRNLIRTGADELPVFVSEGFSDIVQVEGGDLQDHLESAYSNYGADGTMFICRSNKRAYLFNQQIRTRIRWQEDMLSAGDRMMCVKNNYYWLKGKGAASFIANGDLMQIDRIGHEEKLWGMTYVNANITLTDHPGDPRLETILLSDTLTTEGPGLSQAQSENLYRDALDSYAAKGKGAYYALKKDPFFNALHIKYAYAVTCHKAQGGQWPAVFVDAGYLSKVTTGSEFLKWLYTAITRATDKLYLVNFPSVFYGD